MKITLTNIKVSDLINGYENNEEEGVVAYSGKLNVRPKYQREFIYNAKEQKAVIDTVLKNFPLNTMYWVKNEDGTFEVLDGQQRTLSICEFAEGNFAFTLNGNEMYIHNIKRAYPDLYQAFLNYELLVYVCEGSKDEQLNWFTTINIAGKELSEQELRNINYTGTWLTDAKRYFSKTNCPAYQLAKDYIKAEFNRQECLEKVLHWITNSSETSAICEYMGAHQFDQDASELWKYFNDVIEWVQNLFPNYRKEMKSIEWGMYYNKYRNDEFDPDELEEEISNLMTDEDVTSPTGVYKYIFERNEKYLRIRAFSPAQKRRAYEKQKGICPICGEHFTIDKMEADHITPWSEGGKTSDDNCQMLCRSCNRHKSDN